MGAADTSPVGGDGSFSVEVAAALRDATEREVAAARDGGVVEGLVAKDPTLWGDDARDEASQRLGWVDLPTASREHVERLAGHRRDLVDEGLDRVVLCGMGGSSLAPEVITRTAGVALEVVDTTDPEQLRGVLSEGLERTLVVVSSKSGSTVETDSHRRVLEAALRQAGVDDVGRRFVAVTDPGSQLEDTGQESGFRDVVLADPDVGGRYSALSAFGLVPSALAGVDVAALLDDAAALRERLDSPTDALTLGAALGGGAVDGRRYLALAAGGDLPGFGDWAEQLIAESTGKQGRGLLPVVVEGLDAPGTSADDVHLSRVVRQGGEVPDAGSLVRGGLGAQFLAWEYATAVAGRVLGINPFDQPNVQESKDNTNELLEAGGAPPPRPAFSDGPVGVQADADLLGSAQDVEAALTALLDAVPDSGYLAVMCYLDRWGQQGLERLRPLLARRLGRPVTFGWGPRFLHSTGQFHKGGFPEGAFLQVTADSTTDVEVPGRDFTLAGLQAAQAAGDADALTERDRPFLRLHLTDRSAGVRRLLEAAAGDDT